MILQLQTIRPDFSENRRPSPRPWNSDKSELVTVEKGRGEEREKLRVCFRRLLAPRDWDSSIDWREACFGGDEHGGQNGGREYEEIYD